VEITIKVPWTADNGKNSRANADTGAERIAILGPAERNLKMLRENLGVHIVAREARVTVTGPRPAVVAAKSILDALVESARGRQPMNRQQVLDLIAQAAGMMEEETAAEAATGTDAFHDAELTQWDGRLAVFSGGKPIRPRTANQERYIDAIRDNDLVFGIGPAGTGKTYLAVAAAVHLLKSNRVKRLILARPAVEAGEKLGYLPGDLRAKVNPYLRPLFDALADMLDFGTLHRFMENDVVEVVPLAFMRGRTLNHAAIILDEAQNATRTQMLMFLTRLGHGSKMVVTGDPTQIDLPDPRDSGLVDAARRLTRTAGVGWIGFDRSDVVRHSLVQRIIDAYGEDKAQEAAASSGRTLRRKPKSSDNSDDNPQESRSPEGR
jgi:phosphate starvation-inducible protein PhoH and related proteins